MNNDLVSDNTRLRKQLTAIKKELADSSANLDKQRIESAREILKWKAKMPRNMPVSTDANVSNSLDIYLPQGGVVINGNNGNSGHSGVNGTGMGMGTGMGTGEERRGEPRDREAQLRQRILMLEKDLTAARGSRSGVLRGSRCVVLLLIVL